MADVQQAARWEQRHDLPTRHHLRLIDNDQDAQEQATAAVHRILSRIQWLLISVQFSLIVAVIIAYVQAIKR